MEQNELNKLCVVLQSNGIMKKSDDVDMACRNLTRYLKYLCQKSNMTMETVIKHFEDIDNRLKIVGVGDIVYEHDSWDYASGFPKKITKIVDADMGLVETYEDSINKTEIENISEYLLKEA